MHLKDGLRISEPARIAFVGAGGKTSAIIQLADELAGERHQPKPGQIESNAVLVCATTHFSARQVELAEYHYTLKGPDSLKILDMPFPGGINLFSGASVGENRVAGLDAITALALSQFSEKHKLPLLIEADGSRMKPLKAPAEHEPAIPQWVDYVVVVAGLSGLGKSLNHENVYRPEQFGMLSGMEIGSQITPEAIVKLLLHPHGGLKNIPPAAIRVVLLNQANTDLKIASARWISEQLLGVYDAVIVASLEAGDWQTFYHENEQPDRNGMGVLSVHEKTAGIVLAAGGSKRFGKPKQLLDWKGETLVEKSARTALTAGLSPVVVVTGAYADRVRSALLGLPVEVVHNPDWEEGQSSSIRAGLQALKARVGSAIFLLSDQPYVSVSIVRGLVDRHSINLARVIAPIVDGKRGNPVLFDRSTFSDLSSLEGDVGGRALFSRHRVDWLPWQDPNLLLDVDSQSDYDKLIAMGDL